MKSTVSPKGRKGSSDKHPVDRIFGRLSLEKPVDALLDEMRGTGHEEGKMGVDSSVSPPARLGDLFSQVFGPARGASLELPQREPHEPIDLA